MLSGSREEGDVECCAAHQPYQPHQLSARESQSRYVADSIGRVVTQRLVSLCLGTGCFALAPALRLVLLN